MNHGKVIMWIGMDVVPAWNCIGITGNLDSYLEVPDG
jgi:hypothetical protein